MLKLRKERKLTHKLSISIVNTNNKPLLLNCLESLYSRDHGILFETILVDNASTDGSAEAVRLRYPQVKLIINKDKKGFAFNHNQAIRVSGGDYILILNEDTVVKPGALKAMCDFLDEHPETGAAGCRLENPDGTLQKSCYKFPSPLRAIAENLLLVAAFPNNVWFGDYRAWPHDTIRYVDFVSGAALMVRRRVIETTGYLDERFFIYAEETDWCFRMAKDGWKTAFVPDGTVVHYGGQSSVNMKDRQFCEFNRSSIKYFKKHYGIGGMIILDLAMIMGAVIRILLWGAAFLIIKNKKEPARKNIDKWFRLLCWWTGFGPREGMG